MAYISHEDFEKQFKQLLQDRFNSSVKELEEDEDVADEEMVMVVSETQDMFNEVEYSLFGKELSE
tara:strand:+ start:1120 stop:1314 length:195 start_codon:yes stop_codon:yes gene_type:complete